jgi:hypothetical protein
MSYRVIVIPEAYSKTDVSNDRIPYNVYDQVFGTLEEAEAYKKGANALNDGVEWDYGDGTATTQEIIINGEGYEFKVTDENVRAALIAGLDAADGWDCPDVYTSWEDGDEFERVASILAEKEMVQSMAIRFAKDAVRERVLSSYRKSGITLLAVAMAAATDQKLIGVRVGEDFLDVRVSRKNSEWVFNPATGEVEKGRSGMVSPENAVEIDGNAFLNEYPARYSSAELLDAVGIACRTFGTSFREAITQIPKKSTPAPAVSFGM